MQHKVEQAGLQHRIQIDSAGTHAYHVGEQSDTRSRAKAAEKGVDMEYIRARKIAVSDYDDFDYILAMDDDNLELINYYAPQQHSADIRLFLDFANRSSGVSRRQVPDPYYGEADGFEEVFKLVETGCDALLEKLLSDI